MPGATSNLVLCSVFGLLAWRERDMGIWLLYPVTVCVLLGAACYVGYTMRRRAWLGFVSAGWYATAIALGVQIGRDALSSYVLLMGVALLLLMALPGWVMVRQAKRSG